MDHDVKREGVGFGMLDASLVGLLTFNWWDAKNVVELVLEWLMEAANILRVPHVAILKMDFNSHFLVV